MTTVCMYILKDKTFEEAKEFCDYLYDLAWERNEEVIPYLVAQAIDDFYTTSDYDGFGTRSKIKKGTYFIWAHGKDYCMYRLRPKGAKRGYPYFCNPNRKYEDCVADLWEYDWKAKDEEHGIEY